MSAFGSNEMDRQEEFNTERMATEQKEEENYGTNPADKAFYPLTETSAKKVEDPLASLTQTLQKFDSLLQKQGPVLNRLEDTFGKQSDEVDEEKIKRLFRDNEFEKGFEMVH